ncbi:hypothetical protein NU219Hw_g6074t1 [Hortaea werneckii]
MGAAAATATAGGQGGVYQDRYGGYWEMDCGYYFSGSPYYDGAYQGTNGIGVFSCFNGCANRPGCVGFTYFGSSTGPTTGSGRCFHFYNGQQGSLSYNPSYQFPDAGNPLFGSGYLLQANENLLCPTYNGTYYLDAQGQTYYVLCGYGSSSTYQNTAARDGRDCLQQCDAQAQCIGVTVVYGGAETNAQNNANCYLASAGLNTIANTRNVLAVRTTMPPFVPTTTTTTTTTSSTTSAAASSTCTFAVSPADLPTNCGGRSSTASFLGVYRDTCGVTYSIYCRVDSNPQQADQVSAGSISACMALCDNYVFADGSTCQSATLYQGRCYLKRSFDGFKDANTDTTVMVRNSNQNLLLANSSSTSSSAGPMTPTAPPPSFACPADDIQQLQENGQNYYVGCGMVAQGTTSAAYTATNSWNDCFGYCDATVGCTGFTYEGAVDGNGAGTCFLRNSAPIGLVPSDSYHVGAVKAAYYGWQVTTTTRTTTSSSRPFTTTLTFPDHNKLFLKRSSPDSDIHLCVLLSRDLHYKLRYDRRLDRSRKHSHLDIRDHGSQHIRDHGPCQYHNIDASSFYEYFDDDPTTTNWDNDGNFYGEDHGDVHRASDRHYDGYINGKDDGDIYRTLDRDYDGHINGENYGKNYGDIHRATDRYYDGDIYRALDGDYDGNIYRALDGDYDRANNGPRNPNIYNCIIIPSHHHHCEHSLWLDHNADYKLLCNIHRDQHESGLFDGSSSYGDIYSCRTDGDTNYGILIRRHIYHFLSGHGYCNYIDSRYSEVHVKKPPPQELTLDTLGSTVIATYVSYATSTYVSYATLTTTQPTTVISTQVSSYGVTTTAPGTFNGKNHRANDSCINSASIDNHPNSANDGRLYVSLHNSGHRDLYNTVFLSLHIHACRTVTTESISYATSTERTTIVSSYIGTVTETTTASGPTQTVSGPTQTLLGPTQTKSGPTQTISGPTQTESGPTQTVSGPTQTQVITTSYVEIYTTSYPVTQTLPGELH